MEAEVVYELPCRVGELAGPRKYVYLLCFGPLHIPAVLKSKFSDRIEANMASCFANFSYLEPQQFLKTSKW